MGVFFFMGIYEYRNSQFMDHRSALRKIFEPFVVVVAAIYFVFDGVVLATIKPLVRKVARLRIFQSAANWIASLGPYQTLVLFLVPLILLEPTKPLSAYLIASQHVQAGIAILVLGEVLKIVIVERIFHIGRDKLMTIHAFAWTYNFIIGWLSWLKSLPPWQAVKRTFHGIKRWMRRLKRREARSNRVSDS